MNYLVLKKEFIINDISDDPFQLPQGGSNEDKKLLGFMFFITAEVKGKAEEIQFVEYGLEYCKVNYDNLDNIFWTSRLSLGPLVELQNPNSGAQQRVSKSWNVYGATGNARIDSREIYDTAFEFQPLHSEKTTSNSLVNRRNNNSQQKIDFAFLGKSEYRYLLHNILSKHSNTLTITGCKIVIGQSKNVVHVPPNSGDGYFSLKFETSYECRAPYLPPLSSPVYDVPEKSVIPLIAIATPCPPLWRPSLDYSDKIDTAKFMVKWQEFICVAMKYVNGTLSDGEEEG